LQSTQIDPSVLHICEGVQSRHDGPQWVSVSQVTQVSTSHHSPLRQLLASRQSTQPVPPVLQTSPVSVQSRHDVPQCSSTSHATQVFEEHQ
jgi:hypothetical protein